MRLRPALLIPLLACAPLEAPAPPESKVLGIERVEGRGPYVAGAIERFRLASRGGGLAVEWAVSAGQVATVDGLAEWTLPKVARAFLIAHVDHSDGRRETVTFDFDIQTELDLAFAVNAAARGEIATNSSFCQLAIDNQEVPHVIYRDEIHWQLWYARFTGAAWVKQLVDGPGFDIGVLAGATHDLAVTGAGVPHIVYQDASTTQVRYATLNGANWVRETVSPPANLDNVGYPLGIALDPTAADRPTVMWTWRNGVNYEQPVVAYRTGANAWTTTVWAAATNNDHFLGGLAFDSMGRLWFSFDLGPISLGQFRVATGFAAGEVVNANYGGTYYSPLVLDASARPIVLTTDRTFHRRASDWVTTAYDYETTERHDLAYTGGRPRIAMLRNGLQLMQTNSEGYWLYDRVDNMSDQPVSLAVARSGESHACYTKNGSVWFY